MKQDALQLAFSPGSYDTTKLMSLEPFPGKACAAWQHRPKSKGFVRLESLNPHDPPRIQMNYFKKESDRKVLIEAARLGRRICHTPEFTKYFRKLISAFISDCLESRALPRISLISRSKFNVRVVMTVSNLLFKVTRFELGVHKMLISEYY